MQFDQFRKGWVGMKGVIMGVELEGMQGGKIDENHHGYKERQLMKTGGKNCVKIGEA